MSTYSTQSSYHTVKAPSTFTPDPTRSVENIVSGIAFDVLCNKDATSSSSSPDQVRFELKKAPDSSLYTIIKVNNKSYRISVHKQKQQLSYTKDDWQKIESKVKNLLSISSSHGDFSKGTLKLRDRTWTPIFNNKTSESKIIESTAQDSEKLERIIGEIKQLFDIIRPLKVLPSPKELEINPKRTISAPNSLSDTQSPRSLPDTQSSSRKKPLEERSIGQVTTKRRKSNSCTNTDETSNLITTEIPPKEKQESILTKLQGYIFWVTDHFFPKKDPDTLSQLDLSSEITSTKEESQHLDSLTEFEYSDTTSSMGDSLASANIGGSKTVLKDTQGFNLK